MFEARQYLNSLGDMIYFFPSKTFPTSLVGAVRGQLVCIFFGKDKLTKEELLFSAKIRGCLGEVYLVTSFAELTILTKKRGWHD